MGFLSSELLAIAPILLLVLTSLIVLLFEALLKKSEPFSYAVSIIGLALSAIVSLLMIDMTGVVFNKMINVGGYGNLLGALFLVAALLTIILSREYLNKEHSNFGEYYLLILFSTLGMILMASAADLIMVFLGLELMSVCLYVLAGFLRQRQTSNESSLKYFLLGAFATGFLLYGIALLYGASGTTNIRAIVENFSGLSSSPFLWVGMGMLLVGLGFKVGAVPFHMWIPDVYEGSPTPVSGFMSTGSKAAAFAALLLIFSHQQIQDSEKFKLLLSIIAAATMILGNVVALAQSNLKRMLAYSSIAHAGYMLTGLAASNELGHTGILFYLVTYTFMSIGAFGILALLEREGEKNLSYDDYAGLGSKRPILALLMAIFMFSLAGIPPFAGFFGKYYVFTAAVNAHLTWLAIIGVLTSVISVYYYLRLVMVMYFREGDMQIKGSISAASFAVMTIAALAIIELGIFPSSVLSIIHNIY